MCEFSSRKYPAGDNRFLKNSQPAESIIFLCPACGLKETRSGFGRDLPELTQAMGKSGMREWLEFPDTKWRQDPNLGGGRKIINPKSISVKNITITADQFLYNSIYSWLGKEARYAGVARRCGCSRSVKFPGPERRRLPPLRMLL
jgi:hypothetical protein